MSLYLEVGQKGVIKRHTVMCVKGDDCSLCYLKGKDLCGRVACIDSERDDKENIHFVKCKP
jgi:hypothetical protein